MSRERGRLFYFTARFASRSKARAQNSNGSYSKGLRALIVDDNATNRDVVANTLKSWAMSQTLPASGDEALTAMRAVRD